MKEIGNNYYHVHDYLREVLLYAEYYNTRNIIIYENTDNMSRFMNEILDQKSEKEITLLKSKK